MERGNERTGSPLVFARNFLKHPKMLGSMVPSSRYLTDRLLRHVDWQEARVIVELGPGIGNITREVLRRMRPDAVLLALEINDEFVSLLRRTLDDPRLRIVHRPADEVTEALRGHGHGPADVVIAGIPFSIIGEEERMRVLHNARAALRDGGRMLVYQFSGRVKESLEAVFGPVRQRFEPRNVPPARIFECVRRS